jgi:hypothetical protein
MAHKADNMGRESTPVQGKRCLERARIEKSRRVEHANLLGTSFELVQVDIHHINCSRSAQLGKLDSLTNELDMMVVSAKKWREGEKRALLAG